MGQVAQQGHATAGLLGDQGFFQGIGHGLLEPRPDFQFPGIVEQQDGQVPQRGILAAGPD